MKAVVFLLSLSGALNPVFAQQTVKSDLTRFADDLFAYPEEGDDEDLYEDLLQILSSPFDLNKVTGEELRLLNILNDVQIENLMGYRREQGKFLEIYELQAIPEFDQEVISKLKPFVKVTDPKSRMNMSLSKRIFSGGNSYFVCRYGRSLETKKGFLPAAGKMAAYSGSADKLYFRLRSAASGDYSFGVTAEKDPGEKMRFDAGSHAWGFDFTSCHFQVQDKGKIKNLIAGDFQTQFAQGLVLGGAFGLGKGSESVLSARKSNVGFLPYTSINESAYHRGAAVTVEVLKDFLISAFYSRTIRDASIDSTNTRSVRSFQTSGYHRTESEINNRKRVGEESSGLILRLKKTNLDAGAIINAIHFDLPVKRTPALYNQYAFSGSENINAGLFLNFRFRNASFFNEAAQSLRRGRGIILGLLMNPFKDLDLAMVYRNYAPDFYTFYSNAFSENTAPQNEHGVYWGWKYRWSRQYSLAGYVDLFAFPWLSFRRYAPAHGNEWLLRGNYQPARTVSVFVQFRQESKPRNLPDTRLYELGDGIKRNVALGCDYGIGEELRLKSRLQYSNYFFNKNSSEGFALVQDVSFSAGAFRFTGRQALFDTDDHDNRQYVYENDAWLAYSFPSYAGVGVRNYVIIEYKAHKNVTIWIRYARTRLLNEDRIGSGQDIIEGNTKNDVKFQARFNF